MRQEIEQLKRAQEETKTRLTNITQNIDGINASGTKDPHKYDALAALDYELDKKIQALDKTRLEIFNTIKILPDRRYRMLLMGRYYECLSWLEISALMHYEPRHLYRLHGAALQAIQPAIDEKKETVD